MGGALLRPRDVLQILGPVYEWIRSGKLPSVRDGRRIYIARQALDRLMAEIAEGRWPDEGHSPHGG